MRSALFSGLVALVLASTGCSSTITIKKEIINNANHLYAYIESRDDLEEFFWDHEKLKDATFEKLLEREHHYSWELNNVWSLSERPELIYGMTHLQTWRIYLMLEALEDPEFVSEIQKMIFDDLNDPYSEHGGIVVLDPVEGIKFVRYDGKYAVKKDPRNNSRYFLPREAMGVPHIFQYHIHADGTICMNGIGPSLSLNDRGVMQGDVIEVLHRISRDYDAHDIVIEQMEGGRFNMDYYGGNLIRGIIPRFGILDLGVYPQKQKTQEIIQEGLK